MAKYYFKKSWETTEEEIQYANKLDKAARAIYRRYSSNWTPSTEFAWLEIMMHLIYMYRVPDSQAEEVSVKHERYDSTISEADRNQANGLIAWAMQ